MKKITAIVRPEKLESLKDALFAAKVSGMTVSQVQGCGSQHGWKEYYRGTEVLLNMVPKVKFEIICDDAEVDAIKAGFSSGVAFAVSVHIRDAEDLVHKSIIKKLYLTGEFDYVVLLEEYGDTFSVVDLRGGGDEDPWTVDDRTFLRGDRYFTGS